MGFRLFRYLKDMFLAGFWLRFREQDVSSRGISRAGLFWNCIEEDLSVAVGGGPQEMEAEAQCRGSPLPWASVLGSTKFAWSFFLSFCFSFFSPVHFQRACPHKRAWSADTSAGNCKGDVTGKHITGKSLLYSCPAMSPPTMPGLEM